MKAHKNWHNTAIRFPPDVHAALEQAAAERDLSMNWLVNRAVEDFLSRLIPADEIRLTNDGSGRIERNTP